MLDNTEFNYIIFGGKGFYEVAYHDLYGRTDIVYLNHYLQTTSNPIRRILTRFTFSAKVNKVLSFPLKEYTFPRLLTFHFADEKPLCFLFFGLNAFLFHSPYLDYLKTTYPTAKFVLYLQDIVAQNPILDMDKARNDFDVILSYDSADCEKYHLLYYPTPYSTYMVSEDNSIPASDIYFCGKGKERYQQIYSIYENCRRKGLVCDFHITDIAKDAPRLSGINYDKHLSYIENLQHISKTKCILEVMQSGAVGFTPRVWESLFYGKHLLSDNVHLIQSPYYSSQIHILSQDMNTIPHWIDTDIQAASTELKKKLSPLHLLMYIQYLLTK